MLTAEPLVTVCVPVFNGARYLAESLDTHLAQTFADFELVILDNASTDETPTIAEAYARQDPRVRVVRHERNLGVARNFNVGVGLARGTYFRWGSCDDLFAPTSLARCLEVLRGRPDVVLVYPGTMLIDAQGASLGPYEDGLHCTDDDPVQRLRHVTENTRYCNAHYGLMRTDQLRTTGLIGSFPGADEILYRELALRGKFFEIPERLFFRRLHADASSSMSSDQVAAMWHPGSAAQPGHTLRHLAATWAAVRLSPLSLRDRARTMHYVAKLAIWNRAEILSEIRAIAVGR